MPDTDAVGRSGNTVHFAYHFSPPSGWMNDPNGPIHLNGEYHLFYQFNPNGPFWGTIHWGHAISRDLLHWNHLPIALAPATELGELHCFSGCTIIDERGVPRILYTSVGSGERAARDGAEVWSATGDVSLRQWTRMEKNPLITQQVHGRTRFAEWRDPYVIRRETDWLMVLGGSDRGHGVVLAYVSSDLEAWQFRGILYKDETVATIECPCLFRLDDRYVLIHSPLSAVRYLFGTLTDNLVFQPESGGLIDTDTDRSSFYAVTTFLDDSGRRIALGWIPESLDDAAALDRGTSGLIGFPRELFFDNRGRIGQRPVRELSKLRTATQHLKIPELPGGTTVLLGRGRSVELLLRAAGNALSFSVEVFCSERGDREVTSIQFDRADGRLTIDRSRSAALRGAALAPIGTPFDLPPTEDITLHILLDRSVIEVFVNETAAATARVYPDEASEWIRLKNRSNETLIVRTLEISELSATI